jgi:DNA-binding transcriptional ArsR family regulator
VSQIVRAEIFDPSSRQRSLPAVFKHVAVLAQAGLVIREKQGRQPRCRLAATPMKAAMQWLARYE